MAISIKIGQVPHSPNLVCAVSFADRFACWEGGNEGYD